MSAAWHKKSPIKETRQKHPNLETGESKQAYLPQSMFAILDPLVEKAL